ncbi:MAG: hypothetical protein C5B59_01020 [Bacteroidetes bacterium]|nr:MAG: hypothetical protein C5B59_01020 [Bacteroidota bacterium]
MYLGETLLKGGRAVITTADQKFVYACPFWATLLVSPIFIYQVNLLIEENFFAAYFETSPLLLSWGHSKSET